LTQIECHKAQLRRVRARLSAKGRLPSKQVASTPEEHHNIGVSKKLHEHIGTFLQKHAGDPAIQVQIIETCCSPAVLIVHFSELPPQVETASPSLHPVKVMWSE
jgi:hypothetical protein